MPKRKNSYKIEGFHDKKQEILRLKDRTKFKLGVFLDLLRSLPFKGPSKFLEIGSGTGDRSAVLARKFPASLVVGIDVSPMMTSLAKSTFKNLKNLDFINQDLEAYSK